MHGHCVCLVFGAIAIAAATGSADGEITRGKKCVAECVQFSVLYVHILSHHHDCMQMHVLPLLLLLLIPYSLSSFPKASR